MRSCIAIAQQQSVRSPPPTGSLQCCLWRNEEICEETQLNSLRSSSQTGKLLGQKQLYRWCDIILDIPPVVCVVSDFVLRYSPTLPFSELAHKFVLPKRRGSFRSKYYSPVLMLRHGTSRIQEFSFRFFTFPKISGHTDRGNPQPKMLRPARLSTNSTWMSGWM